ncbi:response regulator [Microbulbifer litoralis]|uniref:response regulator n=1 Tax=Microbulbifer litoralis TaxID=2933965 RepID=UPI0020279DC6|nr:hybrid sensor histidine kinase/response regulator [Microbulbifer sp. GX H0434]
MNKTLFHRERARSGIASRLRIAAAAGSACIAPAASALPQQLSLTATQVSLYWPAGLGAALLLAGGIAILLRIRLGRTIEDSDNLAESLRADNKSVYRQLQSYGSELSVRERELGEARETIARQQREKTDLQAVIDQRLRRPLDAVHSTLNLLARSGDRDSAQLVGIAQRQLQSGLQSLDEIQRLGELEAAEPKLPTDSPDSTSLSILLVEASAEGSLIEPLETRGHRVQRETNGIDGAEAALRHNFDLILMDSRLPLLDGVEAAGRIRRGNPDQPIFAMVAGPQPGDKERYQARGLTGVLARPVSDYQLQQLLKWTVRRLHRTTTSREQRPRPTRLLNNSTLLRQRDTLGHLQFAELLSDRIATLPKKITALTSALTGRHWIDAEKLAQALGASAGEIGLEAIAARLQALASRLAIDSEREYGRHQRTELLNLMRASIQQLKAWRDKNLNSEWALQ